MRTIKANDLSVEYELVEKVGDRNYGRKVCEVAVADGAVRVRVRVGRAIEPRTFKPSDPVQVR